MESTNFNDTCKMNIWKMRNRTRLDSIRGLVLWNIQKRQARRRRDEVMDAIKAKTISLMSV